MKPIAPLKLYVFWKVMYSDKCRGRYNIVDFKLLLVNRQHFSLVLTRNTAGVINLLALLFIALPVITLTSFTLHVVTLTFKM